MGDPPPADEAPTAAPRRGRRRRPPSINHEVENGLNPNNHEQGAPSSSSSAQLSSEIARASSNAQDAQRNPALALVEPPGPLEFIRDALVRNYHSVGYSLVITVYFLSFIEYLYLRLVSFILPEKVTYHNTCANKTSRVIGKDGFHYGVMLGAFLVISIFQLICFFGLTISDNWTQCRQEKRAGNRLVMLRHELAAHIRKTIHAIIYRVLVCYLLCSVIIFAIIFYMVGIHDSIDELASTIALYIFDALVLLYFGAFPLTTLVYHPDINCFRRLRSPRPPPVSTLSPSPPLHWDTGGGEGLPGFALHSPPPGARNARTLPAGAAAPYEPFRRNFRLTTTV